MKNLRQKSIRSFLLLAITLFVSLGILSAQGWERTYTGLEDDIGKNVVSTPDGHLYIQLVSEDNLGSGGELTEMIKKLDNKGNTIWTRTVPMDTSANVFFSGTMVATNDGGVLWGRGYQYLLNGSIKHPELIKFDTDGNIEWNIEYPSLSDSLLSINKIIRADGGGFLFLGTSIKEVASSNHGQPYVAKIDENGSILWFKKANLDSWWPWQITETAQQEIVIGCWNNIDDHLGLIKMDAAGNTLWVNNYPDISSSTGLVEISDGSLMMISGGNLIKLDAQGTFISSIDIGTPSGFPTYIPNEGFVIARPAITPPSTDKGIVLTKTDLDGNIIWSHSINYKPGDEQQHGITTTSDGGIVVLGSSTNIVTGDYDAYAFKTNENGFLYGNEFTGTVKWDENMDCLLGNDETPLKNWIVSAERPGRTFYVHTNEEGKYLLPVDTGIFELSLVPPVDYWSVCNNNFTFDFTSTINSETADFAVQSLIDCPYMEVSSAIPYLRPCFENSPLKIAWCNNGTTVATDAYIEVILDPQITPISSTIPWDAQNGDTLIFELGNIQPSECGGFKIDLMLDCNAQIGDAFCIESHIYPDSLCSPLSANWNGAFIELSGTCQDSSVNFKIENTGLGGMTQDGDYIIVEDAVVLMQGNFNLQAGQSSPADFTANGSTYILMSTQEPFAPSNPYPIAILEGCGTNGSGTFSVNYLNQFPQGDNDPFVDIDCPEASSSYDPNDKQGFPRGFGNEHFIEPNTDLEYLIRFQNTGTDTAFTVVVKDTISNFLDLSTIRQSVGSHDYELKILNGNILEFTFANIMLPDSNMNEAASHGFVEFKISQKRDLPLGTVIKNKGAIYFDFNPPIITNETFHTIGLNFITVSLQNPVSEENRILVRPNPMQEVAIFELQKEVKDGNFELYDVTGRKVLEQNFTGQQFEIQRNGIHTGVYFYKITDDNRIINSGKIVVN